MLVELLSCETECLQDMRPILPPLLVTSCCCCCLLFRELLLLFLGLRCFSAFAADRSCWLLDLFQRCGNWPIYSERITRGTRGAVKKKMTKATYICRSAKRKVVTYFILFLFLFLFFIEYF
jgi:hypothetical protein